MWRKVGVLSDDSFVGVGEEVMLCPDIVLKRKKRHARAANAKDMGS